MLRLNWKDQWLTVSRLVFDTQEQTHYTRQLQETARRDGLPVADPVTDPRPGDFWIGCHPVAGWGDADAELIGWASVVEVPIAVAAVRGELRTAGRVPARPQEQLEPQFLAPFVLGAA